MQDKTPTRGFSSSHHVRTDGNAIPPPRRHTPRRRCRAPPLVRRCRAPPLVRHHCPLVRHGVHPTRAAWHPPHSCGMACTPLVPRCGRARCPHRAAAPHGAVRGFASCDNRVWGTHAHYTRPRDDAARWGHRALPPLRTPITWQYSCALPPCRTRFARGGSPPPVGAPHPSCAMPKNENGPEWKTIPTRGDKAQKAISPCCS